MSMDPCDEILGRLVEEFHRRAAEGKQPKAEDFREAAGDCFDRFREVLHQEALLDDLLDGSPAQTYPRTFGEYTLVELIGRGGIGHVYRAVHRPLARTVALKVLQGGWADEKELVERFKRGARAAAQVEHDHVVRIYDVGVYEGRPYIAMSLIEGSGDLKDILNGVRDAGPLPFGPAHHAVLDAAGVAGEGSDTKSFVSRIAALLAGPADALHLYHERGIIHRDVKPANLLLDADGKLVLTDFDMARRLETTVATQSGGALGTPGYMSPEQWDPLIREVDGRADVYALGCVFYRAVAQRRPFEEEDVSDLMKRVLQDTPPDPTDFVPGLPVDARRVLMKALERERDDRYQTAGAFRDDLHALAGGAPVAARPVPVARKARRMIWKRKWPLLVALLAIAIAGTWWFMRPATIHVNPWPSADVWINGKPVATSPIEGHELDAGKHEIMLVRQGFEQVTLAIDLGPGETKLINPRMRPSDPNSSALRDAIFEQTGIRLPPGTIERDRSIPDRSMLAVALFPRGKVRTQDLTNFTAEVYQAFDGEFVVLDPSGRKMLQEPVAAKPEGWRRAVPPRLRDALSPGATYTWRLIEKGETVAESTFVFVEAPDESALAQLREQLGPDQRFLADAARVGFYRRAELHVAALRAAMDLLETHPEKKAELYSYMYWSLEGLGLQETDQALTIQAAYIDAGGD